MEHPAPLPTTTGSAPISTQRPDCPSASTTSQAGAPSAGRDDCSESSFRIRVLTRAGGAGSVMGAPAYGTSSGLGVHPPESGDPPGSGESNESGRRVG